MKTTTDANSYTEAKARVDADERLSAHRETILYDWTESEHLEWVATAPIEEIVDWAETIDLQTGE